MPVYLLNDQPIFPPPHEAEPDGLIAVGGDMQPERLIAAYMQGIFPWHDQGGMVHWYSPDPRLVLFPAELHVPRRLARTIRSGEFRVTFDTAFDKVIRACAKMRGPRRRGTWISSRFIAGYSRLHELGVAHSVETWTGDKLAGGLYGLALGKVFFGESMFARETDASKVALAALCERLRAWNFDFIDCQQTTPHMLQLGARDVSRPEFLAMLGRALGEPAGPRDWSGSVEG